MLGLRKETVCPRNVVGPTAAAFGFSRAPPGNGSLKVAATGNQVAVARWRHRRRLAESLLVDDGIRRIVAVLRQVGDGNRRDEHAEAGPHDCLAVKLFRATTRGLVAGLPGATCSGRPRCPLADRSGRPGRRNFPPESAGSDADCKRRWRPARWGSEYCKPSRSPCVPISRETDRHGRSAAPMLIVRLLFTRQSSCTKPEAK